MLMGRRCCFGQQLEAFALAGRSFLCENRQPDSSKERQQISLQVKCQVIWVSLIIKQSYHSLAHNQNQDIAMIILPFAPNNSSRPA